MYENIIKVLLVEDDEDDYLLTRELLAEIESSRFDLTWATTYEEALETIKNYKPDVCLIDYRLGEYNGVELLRESAERGYGIPIILLTAQDDLDVDLKAMRAGASDYLVKGHIDRPLLERSIRYTIERAKTLQALRTSENKYRQIAETAREGIWMIDAHARTSYVNQRMAEMLGYTVDELLGRHISDFMDETATRETLQKFERRKQGIAEQYERLLKHRDGTPLWVLVATNPIYGPDGDFAGSLGMISDITERKRAEEVRERLAAIVESSQDAILSKTLEGTITSWNSGAEKIYGYTEAEAVGRHISLIVPPERLEELAEIMARLQVGEQIKQMETVRVRRDGTLIDISITTSPIKAESGGYVGASTIARDITERKRAEEEVRLLNKTLEERVQGRTAELEAANRELESFSYSVSHDLRAPLRAIDGFSQAILEDYADRLDDAGQDYLRRVRGAAEHMGHLIDEMLKLFRVTRGELRRTAVDMSTLARLVIAELRKAEPQRALQIEIMEELWAEGDAPLLRVVLENLLGNAWKFTSKREGARIEFGGEQREDGPTVFYVRDNGAGFDMAYAGMLFGAFHRLHTDAEFEGTGIGLATVQRIVRRHGGRAWAVGEVGAGATIFFTLRASGASIEREGCDSSGRR